MRVTLLACLVAPLSPRAPAQETKLDEPLQACRGPEAGGDPGAAVRVALALASEGGPEGWRERCVEAVLENARDGGTLPPAEEKRIRGMVERLSSEGIDERDAGLDELRQYGSKAAPFLKHFLKSGDEEVKTRVKQLLLEWAEPK